MTTWGKQMSQGYWNYSRFTCGTAEFWSILDRRMELEFAMLALGADHSANGLLHIFGGGFDTLTLEKVPGQLPPFFIVVQLSEHGVYEEREHELVIRGINPEGEEKALAHSGNNFKLAPAPTGFSKATIIMQVYLKAQMRGRYEFPISIDGNEMEPARIKHQRLGRSCFRGTIECQFSPLNPRPYSCALFWQAAPGNAL